MLNENISMEEAKMFTTLNIKVNFFKISLNSHHCGSSPYNMIFYFEKGTLNDMLACGTLLFL